MPERWWQVSSFVICSFDESYGFHRLISLTPPDSSMSSSTSTQPRASGFKNIRSAFGSRRKDSKHISFQYLPPAGSGEPDVDTSGLDCRDVLEEECISSFMPVVKHIWPLEKGMEAFRGKIGTSVIRLAN